MGGFREFTKVEILAAMEQHTKQVVVCVFGFLLHQFLC